MSVHKRSTLFPDRRREWNQWRAVSMTKSARESKSQSKPAIRSKSIDGQSRSKFRRVISDFTKRGRKSSQRYHPICGGIADCKEEDTRKNASRWFNKSVIDQPYCWSSSKSRFCLLVTRAKLKTGSFHLDVTKHEAKSRAFHLDFDVLTSTTRHLSPTTPVWEMVWIQLDCWANAEMLTYLSKKVRTPNARRITHSP